MIEPSLLNTSTGTFAGFDNRRRNDKRHEENNEKYNAFVDKFKPKKTTDDCYTPDNVYNAIADWVAEEYSKDRQNFVRPFYPDGDYQGYDYPQDCIVVDNPPFSILVQILKFYREGEIKFFLFAPTLTMFGNKADGVCNIVASTTVTYENGAEVNTSFITNLEPAGVRSAPTLFRAVEKANEENIQAQRKQLPKYEYPNEILTATMVKQYSRYGVDFRLYSEDLYFIRALDSQRCKRKTIFGGGFLLSEEAKAKKITADKAIEKAKTKFVWELSEREREIIRKLG